MPSLPPSGRATRRSWTQDALHFENGARYDVIAVTASLPLYDARFERMLNVGGRLFIVIGEAPGHGGAAGAAHRSGAAGAPQSLFETVIDPLVHAVRPPEFTF